ncbi:MAG: hypothetical protein MI923_15005 [Phycisphaerales bacterium]|nr:hypothetical protein [Phycisphaerales bacterium]
MDSSLYLGDFPRYDSRIRYKGNTCRFAGDGDRRPKPVPRRPALFPAKAPRVGDLSGPGVQGFKKTFVLILNGAMPVFSRSSQLSVGLLRHYAK